MPYWGQTTLQDACSPAIIQLSQFHDHALVVLALVVSVIGYFLTIIVNNEWRLRFVTEAQHLETVWTVLPATVLIFLAIPSIRLLYIIDECFHPSTTVKAIGHQWYWSYEYADFGNFNFDSYITATSDLKPGEYRLLETDNRIVLPYGLESRVLITSADVIHSWTIPSLGVKIDAIPGRLNQIGFVILYPGLYFGQCSEICGANHSFIPIAIEAVDPKDYATWGLKVSSTLNAS